MSLTTIAALAVALPPLPYAAEQRGVLRILESYNAQRVESLTPREAREAPLPGDAAADFLARRKKPAKVPIGDVGHLRIAGPGGPILIRSYRPAKAPAGPLPGIVYFHGGGFVIASINAYDNSARALANASGAIVFSVAYRQAPENPYPAPFDDAEAATNHVMTNAARLGLRPGKIAVAGESAGGNLATSVTYRRKAKGQSLPVHQLLVYPVTDWSRSTDAGIEKYAEAVPLNKPMLGWFKKWTYPSSEDAAKPDASPFLHPADHFRGFPPATFVFAEIDPLKTQGLDYARKLRSAGVRTEAREYRGVAHEFFGMVGAVPQATSAMAFAGARLKAALR